MVAAVGCSANAENRVISDPITIGAKPDGARRSVASRLAVSCIRFSTRSVIIAADVL